LRALLVLLVVLCVLLFVAGLIAPPASRRLQRRFERLMRRGETKGSDNAGRLGNTLDRTIGWGRRAGAHSADAGRRARRKVSKR
jgi:hypothetical protein